MNHADNDVLAFKVTSVLLGNTDFGAWQVLLDTLHPLIEQELFVHYDQDRHLKLCQQGTGHYGLTETAWSANNTSQLPPPERRQRYANGLSLLRSKRPIARKAKLSGPGVL